MVTFILHACSCKYKVHKLHQRYLNANEVTALDLTQPDGSSQILHLRRKSV